ncbi:uncharacterized protein V1518DRAFT_378297 [Limtongia smithiae]|uniref:uncharacterized protein n=1 Tax=Limtongia smithiae TaxID=1125753 RepID=UPI0034CED555
MPDPPSLISLISADVKHTTAPSSTVVTTTPRVCAFCNKQYGKYHCPRCSSDYCSVICFKSIAHRKCNTAFQTEKRREELSAHCSATTRQMLPDDEKLGLRELVNEYELDAEEHPLGDYEDYADGEGGADIHDRMAGVDVEAAEFGDLWNRLTANEQAEFMKLAEQHRQNANNNNSFLF